MKKRIEPVENPPAGEEHIARAGRNNRIPASGAGLAILLLILLILIVFLSKVWGQFLADDFILLMKAERFVTSVKELLTFGAFKVHHNSIVVAHGYRPLPLFALMLVKKVFGLDPIYYHAIMLLLHAANSFLLYLLAREFVQERDAFVGAAIFAVFTGHIEAVQWLACIPDLFGAFFLLGSILLLVQFTKSGRLWMYGCSLLFAFLSILSKEAMITLPAIVFLTLVTVEMEKGLDVRRISSAVLKTIPYVFLFLFYLVVREIVLRHEGISPNYYSAFFHPRVLPQYFVLFSNLALPHDRAHLARPFLKVAAGLFLPLFGLIFLLRVTSRKALFFWLSWLLITAFPSLGFINPNIFWSRFNYLPALGFCIIVGQVVTMKPRHSKLRLSSLIPVLVIAVFSLNTIYQNQYWLKAWKISSLVQQSLRNDVKPLTSGKSSVYLFNTPEYMNYICLFSTGVPEYFLLLGTENGHTFYLVDRRLEENPEFSDFPSRYHLFEWDFGSNRFRKKSDNQVFPEDADSAG